MLSSLSIAFLIYHSHVACSGGVQPNGCIPNFKWKDPRVMSNTLFRTLALSSLFVLASGTTAMPAASTPVTSKAVEAFIDTCHLQGRRSFHRHLSENRPFIRRLS